jgi:glycosyltransferase involved in cell wall biosynthesis
VLFVTHSLNLEGAPRSLFETATALDRARFDLRLWSPVPGPLEGAWAERGVETRILSVDPQRGGRDDYEAMVRRLAGLASTSSPDLVVANTLETFWAIHVADELGVPAVWVVRESEDPSGYFHARWPTAIAERGEEGLDLADAIVFVADATRSLFRPRVDEARTRLIPNGLDLAAFDPATLPIHRRAVRRPLGLGADTPLLLCVGTSCMRKGQLELVRALALVRERVPDFCCVMLGVVENDYRQRLEAAIDELELRDRIVLRPPTEAPLPWIAAADGLVCPSFQESLPRVVLEAMGFGRPIVATDVHGVPELVRDGIEAWLVAPGDVGALADAIARMLLEPAEAARRGERARARVESHYTLDRCVARYDALLTELLADAGTGPV